MTDSPDSRLVQRLIPEVTGYRAGPLHLGEDLEHLETVLQAGAPEAAVVYCARILEALTADALWAAGLEPGDNLFSNLETLRRYNLVPAATASWAHALRRTGNLIRHVRRHIESEDVQLALLFIERWLEWFFCSFRQGRRLATLTRDGGQVGLGNDAALQRIFELLENLEQNLDTVLRELPLWLEGELLRAPAAAGVLAELLLDRGRYADAERVLDAVLTCFPDDLRLLQLQCLCWSRTGDLDRALACLEALHEQHQDDETVGILAGIYKRLWLGGRGADWLTRAARAYRFGWKASRGANAYLGINAASLALWAGFPAESRVLADRVCQLLIRRATVLAGDEAGSLNYWDQLSLAEGELLAGRIGRARRLYQQAFASSQDQNGRDQVARQQLRQNLSALGMTDDPELFLGRSSAIEPFLIGVTGHRILPDEALLRNRVREVLEELRVQAAPAPLGVLSSLAEGADRLVASLVLAPPLDGSLRVVMPLETADYGADFGSEASLTEFQGMLDRADEVIHPPPAPSAPSLTQRTTPLTGEEREAGYEWAGREVVNRCQVLLALWDGLPARGQGGTASIVAHARSLGRPLVWINTTPPCNVVKE
jgi:tetratricopeptide (TPR) repeat protein